MSNLFQTAVWIPQQSPINGDRSDYVPVTSSRPFDHPCYHDIDLDYGESENPELVAPVLIGDKTAFKLLDTPGLPKHLTNMWLVQGWKKLVISGSLGWPSTWMNPATRPSLGYLGPEVVTIYPIPFSVEVDITDIFPAMQDVGWGARGTLGKTRGYGYQGDAFRRGEPSQLEWAIPQNYAHLGVDWDIWPDTTFFTEVDEVFAFGTVPDVLTDVFAIMHGTTSFSLRIFANCQANASVLRSRIGDTWYYFHTFRVNIFAKLFDQLGLGGPYEYESTGTVPFAAFTTDLTPLGFPEALYDTPADVPDAVGAVGLEDIPYGISNPIYCLFYNSGSSSPPTPEFTVNAGFDYIGKRSTSLLIGP